MKEECLKSGERVGDDRSAPAIVVLILNNSKSSFFYGEIPH